MPAMKLAGFVATLALLTASVAGIPSSGWDGHGDTYGSNKGNDKGSGKGQSGNGIVGGSGGISMKEEGTGAEITGHCSGGQIFSAWNKEGECSCESGYAWRHGKCQLPVKPKPAQAPSQACYCAKSSTDYKTYDDGDDYCGGDGVVVFCCEEKDLAKKLEESCPSHPACGGEQTWSYGEKKCVCPAKKVYSNGLCGYPPMSPVSCDGGKNCYCAVDPEHIALYDKGHEYCADNGHNNVFCSKPGQGEPEKYCNGIWGKKGQGQWTS